MKPRNHVVLDLIQNPRKSGKHQKSPKSSKFKEKIKLREQLNQLDSCDIMKDTR